MPAYFRLVSAICMLVTASPLLLGQEQQKKKEPDPAATLQPLFQRAHEFSPIRVEQRHLKHNLQILRSYSPCVESARRSTFRVMQDAEQVALATAVHAGGYAITKLSEIDRDKSIQCEDFEGKIQTAELIDTVESWDLALLKMESLTVPVSMNELDVEVGRFVAAADISDHPLSVGTISVARRRLIHGFLGIQMEDATNGVRVVFVVPESAAQEAGIKPNDVVQQLDGEKISTLFRLRNIISAKRPGQRIRIQVLRKNSELEFEPELKERPINQRPNGRFDILGLQVSKRKTGFPVVLQHDLFLRPDQCGGPLVDLDGHVIGINIARNDRVASYAIPADQVARLIDVDINGEVQFAKPMTELLEELNLVQNKIDQASAALDQHQAKREALKRAIQRARDRDVELE